ncbi:MAG: glycosyltransferase family 4 protein [Gaiellaceae bacterium MAG52_C11]|nr:glycosyltransferase family 4 protein [Candidatus Gaiellasilicea maunaloa]
MSEPIRAAPIRVLRVIARLNMGGPALHVAYLSAGLAERGYETTLVAGSLAPGEGSMAYVAEDLGVRIVKLDALSREISPVRDAISVVRLARLIRELRPQILHTHTAKAGTVGRLAALLAGDARPPIVVHTFHGHVLHGYFGPLKSRAFRLLERLLARVTTRLIAVSPQVRDDLVSLGVAPAEMFSVVRLGIELGERVQTQVAGGDTRARLGITPGRFVVGWVGRMTGVKRTDDVLESLARLRERGIDAVLVMIGDGPDRDAVEQRASELGIVRHCYFLGYQEDVSGWYRAFDALILPSANEGTPVVVIEALASGCPVVATSVGGVPDVVREGVDGFLVPAGDVEALAERLALLASEPELRDRMGEAGRESVPSRYVVERLVGDIDDLYRSLLA